MLRDGRPSRKRLGGAVDPAMTGLVVGEEIVPGVVDDLPKG